MQNEVKLLLELLPKYLAHVEKHPHTLLVKFFGLYRVVPESGSKVRPRLYYLSSDMRALRFCISGTPLEKLFSWQRLSLVACLCCVASGILHTLQGNRLPASTVGAGACSNQLLLPAPHAQGCQSPCKAKTATSCTLLTGLV